LQKRLEVETTIEWGDTLGFELLWSWKGSAIGGLGKGGGKKQVTMLNVGGRNEGIVGRVSLDQTQEGRGWLGGGGRFRVQAVITWGGLD